MKGVKDMTAGNPARLIVAFALPMLLGNLFQQVYSLVDTVIVGRFIGVSALAAVGATGTVDWMVLGTVISLAQGFSILVSQRFGAEDPEGLRKAIAMSVCLSGLIGLLATAASVCGVGGLLRLLNTPADILPDAHSYIRTLFIGMPVVLFYNLFSSILRALGDSKSPLYALVIATFINVGLDLFFVVGLNWGVVGAAAASVLAQLFSSLYCLRAVWRIPICRLSRRDWRPEWDTVKRLVGLGIPMALQNGITAAGGMILQYLVNGYGSVFVAGFTTAHRICNLMEQVGMSFGNAMATYTGQNFGARRFDRIRQGVRKCALLTVGISLVIGGTVFLLGRGILALIVSSAQTEVIGIAYQYLTLMCGMLFVLYLLFLFRSTLQGMGDTFTPMLSGGVELAVRILVALTLPLLIGRAGIFYAEVGAWLGAALLLAGSYFWKSRHFPQESPLARGAEGR